MKINENVILNTVAPYTAGSTLTCDAFNRLFSALSREERDKVTGILAAHGIRLVNPDDDTDGIGAMNNEQLVRAAQAGSEEAKSEICTRNWNLVRDIARRYAGMCGSAFSADDLEMAGMCGMMKAVERFNYALGWKFTTYAEWWIRQAITREIANSGYTIRIPVHKQDQIRKVYRMYHDRFGELPSEIRTAKTAEALGMSVESVAECLRLRDCVMSCPSLDSPVGEDGDTVLGDFIPADRKDTPEIRMEKIFLKSDVTAALRTLEPREQEVITKRFGLDGRGSRTLEEIAKNYGVTRERIRQIEKKALDKLRHPSCSRRLRPYLGGTV